ncbi:hypothetical protein [uncultured Clostridium sp.]|uniref:hypothetical protein n=1 Tax=uncultured Clostridium sp. TaxID=59620 RepID=UPI0028E2A627|nr:hypothetical protein [uncultured Clostridium sp.]
MNSIFIISNYIQYCYYNYSSWILSKFSWHLYYFLEINLKQIQINKVGVTIVNKVDLEIIKTKDDVFNMLDSILEKHDSEWWNNFYSNKDKLIPFFKNNFRNIF